MQTASINSTLTRFIAICTLCVLSAGTATAGIIFEDDFESDTAGIPAPALINWDINTPSIDVVGGSSFGQLCNGATAGQCLDMDGTPGNGSMTSKLTFNLGAGDYLFSFDYGNNSFNGNTLSWVIGSVSGLVSSGVANNNTYTHSLNAFTLAAAETVSITFSSGGPADNGGTILDNVKLESLTPVPAPASLGLLGVAFLILGWRRKSITQ